MDIYKGETQASRVYCNIYTVLLRLFYLKIMKEQLKEQYYNYN